MLHSTLHFATSQIAGLKNAFYCKVCMEWFSQPLYKHCEAYKEISGGDTDGGTIRFGPFLLIAFLLFLLWGGGFLVFHAASVLIHILLILAVISLIMHLVSASKTA